MKYVLMSDVAVSFSADSNFGARAVLLVGNFSDNLYSFDFRSDRTVRAAAFYHLENAIVPGQFPSDNYTVLSNRRRPGTNGSFVFEPKITVPGARPDCTGPCRATRAETSFRESF